MSQPSVLPDNYQGNGTGEAVMPDAPRDDQCVGCIARTAIAKAKGEQA